MCSRELMSSAICLVKMFSRSSLLLSDSSLWNNQGFIYFMCVCIHTLMYVCYVHTSYIEKTEEEVRSRYQKRSSDPRKWSYLWLSTTVCIETKPRSTSIPNPWTISPVPLIQDFHMGQGNQLSLFLSASLDCYWQPGTSNWKEIWNICGFTNRLWEW